MRVGGHIGLAICGAVATVWLGLAPGAGAAVASAGVGDPYFPKAGNGGYDVRRYDVGLDIQPGANEVDGDITIKMRATERLSRFDLDFRGPEIGTLTVDGEDADFERNGQELRITPPQHLTADAHEIHVTYSGTPPSVTDPDGSTEGWVQTPDGSVALGEPQGTPAWLPCNDHPTDKARFDFALTVPTTHAAISNGTLESQVADGPDTTFTWRQHEPMPTYLAVIAVGTFNLEETTYDEIPAWNAVDLALAAATDLDPMEDILAFEGDTFGPYPFAATGAIVDPAVQIGYALETQTRPYYPVPPSESLLTHELAHQWFGDSVSLRRWKQIWLNEGFATYAEWLYDEHTGGPTTAETFDDNYSTDESDHDFWNPPPGNPGGPENMFDETIYTRGAMTLEVLRQRIGDDDFFTVLTEWVERHRYGNGTTRALLKLAESISGKQLDGLFHKWLFKRGKPEYHGSKAPAARAVPPAPPAPALR
jgi:aminopeptidase N